MPIYEYECLESGHHFEVQQKIADRPIEKCQVCGAKVKKLISRSAFLLKGGGWYKDGYSSRGSANTSGTCSSASSCENSSSCAAGQGDKSKT